MDYMNRKQVNTFINTWIIINNVLLFPINEFLPHHSFIKLSFSFDSTKFTPSEIRLDIIRCHP